MNSQLNPKILTQPNIPKPLHGVNPRTILGKAWWDENRQAQYERAGYCCEACGVLKTRAKYHRWLECHEVYDIDYPKGRMKFTGLIALCHSCHNFIHSGRLWMLYQGDKISTEKYEDIMLHGFGILRNAGLKPWYGTAMMWLMYQGYTESYIPIELKLRGIEQYCGLFADWSDWRLVIDGVEYEPLHESIEAWSKHYSEL